MCSNDTTKSIFSFLQEHSLKEYSFKEILTDICKDMTLEEARNNCDKYSYELLLQLLSNPVEILNHFIREECSEQAAAFLYDELRKIPNVVRRRAVM